MKLHFLHLQVKEIVGFDWIVKYMCLERRGFKIIGLNGVAKKESRFRGEPKLHFDEILLHKGEYFLRL